MQKLKDIYTLPAEFGWNNLGSWGSLCNLLTQYEEGNVKVGNDIRLYDCQNCVLHATDEIKDLDGYVVAKNMDNCLFVLEGGADN